MSSVFRVPSSPSDLNTWISQTQSPTVDPSTNPQFRRQRDSCLTVFDAFTEDEQINFIGEALRRMTANQVRQG
jgi:uncharacterized protein YbcC (UPF0753/DUF2309 family)